MILSVVIPTRNKVDLLRQTLSALREQTGLAEVDWEVVVVDDASSDGTPRMLAGEFAAASPKLRVVTAPTNVGRARARNLGVQAAQGRWVLFLDDDIVAPASLVRAHLDLLETDDSFGTIGCVVTSPELVDAPHLHYLDTRGVARLPAGPAPARFFVTQNAAVPRHALLSVGGFDETFQAYGFEDMELAFRLEDEAGIRFQVLREPAPRHVHHHSLAEYLGKKVECGRHSLPLIARLHPARIPEMRLHYVVDPPDLPGLGWPGRLVRRGLFWLGERGWGGRLDRWPARSGGRPLLPEIYFYLMNLAVISSYAKGLTESQTPD